VDFVVPEVFTGVDGVFDEPVLLDAVGASAALRAPVGPTAAGVFAGVTTLVGAVVADATGTSTG